jgi:hypothetical protein
LLKNIIIHRINLNVEINRRTWTTVELLILLWRVFLTHFSLNLNCLLFLNWIVLYRLIICGFLVIAGIHSRLSLLESVNFCIMRCILVDNCAFNLINCWDAFMLHKSPIYFPLFKLELSLLVFDVLVFLLEVLQNHFSEYLCWPLRCFTRSLTASKLSLITFSLKYVIRIILRMLGFWCLFPNLIWRVWHRVRDRWLGPRYQIVFFIFEIWFHNLTANL